MALNSEIQSLLAEKEPVSGKTGAEILSSNPKFKELLMRVARSTAVKDPLEKERTLDEITGDIDAEIAVLNIELLDESNEDSKGRIFQNIAELSFLRDRLGPPNAMPEVGTERNKSTIDQWRDNPKTLPIAIQNLQNFVDEVEIASISNSGTVARQVVALENQFHELRSIAEKRVQQHQSTDIDAKLAEENYLHNLLKADYKIPKLLFETWVAELTTIHPALNDARNVSIVGINSLSEEQLNTQISEIVRIQAQLAGEANSYRTYPQESQYAQFIKDSVAHLVLLKSQLETRKSRLELEKNVFYQDAVKVDTIPFTPTDEQLPRVLEIYDRLITYLDTFVKSLSLEAHDKYRDVTALRDRLIQRREKFEKQQREFEEKKKFAATALEKENELNLTQKSVLYFLEQKRAPFYKDLVEQLKKGDPNPEYIDQLADLILTWMSEAINDWRYNRKAVRTASWVDNPFYGPNSDFKLREAVVVTPYQQFSISSLEGLLDNFGSLYKDEASIHHMDEVRSRLFDQLSQYEVLHNRGAVVRKTSNKESPEHYKETLNTLKKDRDFAPELGKLFVDAETFAEMTEREKRISVGTEFVFRIFCAQSLKEYEKAEFAAQNGFGAMDLWGVKLPSVKKYLNRKEFNLLPYYRTQDKTKLRALFNEIASDLEEIGIQADDEAGILLCMEGGMSASVGLGVDILLDWDEKYDPATGKLESTVNASQDAAPKAVFPAYFRSTKKDSEKKKPNVAISDYIGQAVGPYARTACYTYIDQDGTRRRDSLLRIVAKGLTRTIDWESGSTNVDENVSDQFATYFDKIYKPFAFCDPKAAPFTIKERKTESYDSADEMEGLKRYLGIAPEDYFTDFVESINRVFEGAPIIGKFYGSPHLWETNYLALRPYLDHDGHELQASELQAQAESFYQPILVDFRQYWLNAVNTDLDTYPWDTIVRLRNLFTTKASIPGLDGAMNQHIKDILFDASLEEVEPPVAGEAPSDEYTELVKEVKRVQRKIRSYLKYGLLQEMILYLYMPLYENNTEFMELMHTAKDKDYKKMIKSPKNYDLEKYVVTTNAGFPVFSTREYDVLLGALRETWERLSKLSKKNLEDVEGPEDFKYGIGWDATEPEEPFIKTQALKYIQEKYHAAPGTHYEDVSSRSKSHTEDWQMRPVHEKNPGVQGLINLMRLREVVLEQRKTR